MKPYPRDLAGCRVTVMGLGRFGGGLDAARWLAGQGARVRVTDTASPDSLRQSLDALQGLVDSGAVTLCLGRHVPEDFTETDLVVANPAVPRPWQNPFLTMAREAGVPVTTEIRLCVDRLDRARTIAVTGSAGKSSTSSMLTLLLNTPPHRARLGGNIGGSLLNDLPAPGEWAVLELSSAMLWWLGEGASLAGQDPWSPRVAVLTNLAPNHVDWHGALEHYYVCKRMIRAAHPEGNAFVSLFAHEQPAEAERAARACGEAWWQDVDLPMNAATLDALLEEIELPLAPGQHQRRNARLALLAAETALRTARASSARAGEPLGAPPSPERAAMLARLREYRSLPHRLEFIGEFRGLRCFNDSKSTTPDATLLAVAAFPDPGEIHLIAGGYDKRVDLGAVRDLAPRLAGLYAIGATAEQLAPAPPAEVCGTLERAVRRAVGRARPGQILLLSPACASTDQFANYEERGAEFTRLVRGL